VAFSLATESVSESCSVVSIVYVSVTAPWSRLRFPSKRTV